jgi:periplasmic protein TonB
VPYSRASANRVFGHALLASIVLHVFLLAWQWPQLGEALKHPAEILAPLMARLMEPAPPPPAPAPPVEERVAAAPKPVAKPRPRPEAKAAPAPRLEPPERAAEPAPAPAPAPAPIAKAAPAPQPEAALPADNTPSLIAKYRAALLAEAGRYKRYPPQALDNGWEGEVVVRMAIAADGSIAAVKVKSSSGHAALDRQALEMFRKASAEVRLPDPLRGRQFSLELRAVFNLKDQASG